MRSWDSFAGMDGAEIEERGGGESSVAAPGSKRHEESDRGQGGEETGHGERREDEPVMPVKVMAGSEIADPGAQNRDLRDLRRGGMGRLELRASCVEETISDVDGPRSEAEGKGNPEGQFNAGGPGEAQRPGDGYRRGIEAGEVPKAGKTSKS